jgi:serine/threonine-protein kinase
VPAALEDEPPAGRQTRRRPAAIVGGVAVTGAGAAVAGVLALGGGGGERAARPCQGLERTLDGVWDPARRDALDRAMAATGKTYAADTASRVIAALDDHARALNAARLETCEATAVRKEQSAELLDRRMGCLDRRRAEMGATVTLIVDDAAATLPRALDAVLALPPAELCEGASLVDALAPPTDAATAARIAAVRVDLDRAQALARAGRWKDVLAPAEAAVSGARGVGWPPLSAEALGVAAKARLITGDVDGAERGLHEAIAAASTARDVYLHGRLTVSLVEVANRKSRFDEVEGLAALADATLGSGEDRWPERATLAAERGRAARAQNRLDDARRLLEQALALREAHTGPDSITTARSLNDLGNLELAAARFAEAEALFKRAMAIFERQSGPNHPDVALSLGRLAVAAKELDRHDESVAALRRSIDILVAAEGELAPSLATAWANLGVVLGAQGKGEESLAAYQKAMAVREKVLPPDHPDLASSIMNVGVALHENLGRPAEAVPYFERARDILRGKLGADHPTLAFALHGLGAARVDMKAPGQGVPELEEAYRIRSGKHIDPRLKAHTGYMLTKALHESSAPRTPARARATALGRETYKAFVALELERDAWLDQFAPNSR